MRVGDRFAGIVVDAGGTRLAVGQGLVLEISSLVSRTEPWVRQLRLDEDAEPVVYWVIVLEPRFKTHRPSSPDEEYCLEARLHKREEGRWVLEWATERVELIISW